MLVKQGDGEWWWLGARNHIHWFPALFGRKLKTWERVPPAMELKLRVCLGVCRSGRGRKQMRYLSVGSSKKRAIPLARGQDFRNALGGDHRMMHGGLLLLPGGGRLFTWLLGRGEMLDPPSKARLWILTRWSKASEFRPISSSAGRSTADARRSQLHPWRSPLGHYQRSIRQAA